MPEWTFPLNRPAQQSQALKARSEIHRLLHTEGSYYNTADDCDPDLRDLQLQHTACQRPSAGRMVVLVRALIKLPPCKAGGKTTAVFDQVAEGI